MPLVPVLTDVSVEDWNISVEKAESNITSKTKAIIPVHLYGNPANMDEIMTMAGKHGLTVIEDCAEATGAMYHGKKVGTFGHIGCYSFFGNKIITTGEGGMCITYLNNIGNHPLISVQNTHSNRNVNWIFTLRINGFSFEQRDQLMELLKSKKIDSRPVFYPIHQMPFYADPLYTRGNLQNSLLISREGISIPPYIGLSAEKMKFIIQSITESLEKIRI
jgi:dTDP-4-amino-4,6-dideoxygalactose transaminase